jgi:acyl carrier protein
VDKTGIQEKLFDVLVQELGLAREKLKLEASFEKDLEVDSLGVVELLMALEDAFGVTIPDEEAEGIVTVGDAVSLLVKKLGA